MRRFPFDPAVVICLLTAAGCAAGRVPGTAVPVGAQRCLAFYATPLSGPTALPGTPQYPLPIEVLVAADGAILGRLPPAPMSMIETLPVASEPGSFDPGRAYRAGRARPVLTACRPARR